MSDANSIGNASHFKEHHTSPIGTYNITRQTTVGITSIVVHLQSTDCMQAVTGVQYSKNGDYRSAIDIPRLVQSSVPIREVVLAKLEFLPPSVRILALGWISAFG